MPGTHPIFLPIVGVQGEVPLVPIKWALKHSRSHRRTLRRIDALVKARSRVILSHLAIPGISFIQKQGGPFGTVPERGSFDRVG